MTSIKKRNLRIGATFVLILAMTVAIAYLGLVSIQRSDEALQRLSTTEIDRQVLVEAWTHETRLNLLRVAAALRTPGTAFARRLETETKETSQSIDRTEARLRDLISEPEGRKLLEQVSAARDQYLEVRMSLVRRSEAGEDVLNEVDQRLEPLEKKYLAAQETLNRFLDSFLAAQQAQALERSVRTQRRIEIGTLAVVLLGCLLAGLAIQSERGKRLAHLRMRHMAEHDTLTGLANRSVLSDRLRTEITKARAAGDSVTVAFIDLDGFKAVNDQLGHPAGDKLLKIVSNRLRGAIRSGDVAVRIGGDEFAVLFRDSFASSTNMAQVFDRIVEALNDVVTIDGMPTQVSCSMGIAEFPGDGNDDETLLQHADAAMYEAKRSGGNRVRYFCQMGRAQSSAP